MKPSGIEWIGDIPDDWEVRKITTLLDNIGSGTTPPNNTDFYENGIIPWLNTGDLTDNYVDLIENKITEYALNQYSALKIFPKDSVVIAMYGATIGKLGILRESASTNQACCVMQCNDNLYFKFLFYSLYGYREYILTLSYGSGQPNISQKIIKDLRLPTPPLKTQQKIADYLDEKCGEIDATIAKQKESIEKLKAYKQSLISETVTKGLDKSAPLKPSGIEWIGDIPAHWEVCKIKNHCNLKTGSTPSSKDLSMFDGTENWFTPSDFTENYMLKNSLRRLNAKVFDQNLVPIFPPLSVLIVGIGATTGKVGFTTSKSSSNQQITAIIPKNKNIFPKFLLFWMIANTKMIRETALFTTLPILNNDTLGNATLLIPPYKEQLELASYIENKNIEIDVIINKKQNIIQKLDAYKKSLIFECVTGKHKI